MPEFPHSYRVYICLNKECRYHDQERVVYPQRVGQDLGTWPGSVFCVCSPLVELKRVKTMLVQ